MNASARPDDPATPACVWRRVEGFADLTRLHRFAPQRYPHLLESVAHGPPQARYDILFAFPGDCLLLQPNGQVVLNDIPQTGDFLEVFNRQWHNVQLPDQVVEFPFHGGWFVFLAYELARFMETSLTSLPAIDKGPVAMAVRFPAAVIRDHESNSTFLVCEAQHSVLLDQMEIDWRQTLAASFEPDNAVTIENIKEEDPALYRKRFARTLDYIQAGDTYQVNLSRAWRVLLKQFVSPIALYERLRQANPAPFAGLMTLGNNRAVISSSPERLVSVRRGRVNTRPIAGTYPRSSDANEDRALAQALVGSPKERAEHVMLVDLERNDLGRLCRAGSVHAEESLQVESYRHVHHIVSAISGELNPGVTPGQVIRAVFPGGTITGCPKLRTMQIIAELEGSARGAYTGSMGYINRDGSLDLNILIRTLVQDGKNLELRAGGGIVADSNVERELNETRVKAKGMLAALGITDNAT